MKPALKGRDWLVEPDEDERDEEVDLGHPLLLSSIELQLEYRQQKEPERSQRGVGNCVAVPEQRILVKSKAYVSHGSPMVEVETLPP